jgi:hypothetical protein
MANVPTNPFDESQLSVRGSIIAPGNNILEKITRQNGYGSLASALTASFYGINHRGMGNPVPLNNNQYGMVFFTRPRLNLSYDNVIFDRTFTPMLSTEKASVARAVRAILDPVGGEKDYPSTLIDPKSAFINILGNNCTQVSGWIDPVVDSYISKPGLYQESYGFVDGFAKIFKEFQLSVSIRNALKTPISYLINTWCQYEAFVHEGSMDPYLDALLENEIDYNTRIYSLTLDVGRQYVEGIAATGAAYPTTNNRGALADFNSAKPITDGIDDIQITFQCFGAIYDDPILFQEFNQVVVEFNSDMDDARRASKMTKLKMGEKPLFNYTGYPRINPDTSELEWWVANADYTAIITNFGPVTTAAGKPPASTLR